MARRILAHAFTLRRTVKCLRNAEVYVGIECRLGDIARQTQAQVASELQAHNLEVLRREYAGDARDLGGDLIRFVFYGHDGRQIAPGEARVRAQQASHASELNRAQRAHIAPVTATYILSSTSPAALAIETLNPSSRGGAGSAPEPIHSTATGAEVGINTTHYLKNTMMRYIDMTLSTGSLIFYANGICLDGKMQYKEHALALCAELLGMRRKLKASAKSKRSQGYEDFTEYDFVYAPQEGGRGTPKDDRVMALGFLVLMTKTAPDFILL